LSGNQIGNEGCAYLLHELAKANTVAVLKLNANDLSAAAGSCIAEFLSTCRSCVTLHLKSNKLSDAGIAKISDILGSGKKATLTNLNLTNCDITKTGLFFLLKALKKNNYLTSLTLNHNSFESMQPFLIFKTVLN
jgi:Ran GTPase-activating protein (RanGAP) involved in mRNA processing and transport